MVRSIPRVAGIAILSMVPFSAAQQTGDSPARQSSPPSASSSTIERNAATATRSRSIQTRTESNGHEVITQTTELPGPDGKLRPSLETTTETVRSGSDSTTKHDVFTTDPQGQRRLVETRQTEAQTQSNGTSRSVANTFVPDVNGRLGLSIREVQETKAVAPNVTQTDTSIYRPGINEPLRESERLQETERKVSSNLTQTESTRFLRDGSGRWQATETRTQEVRTAGTERVEEETVHRANASGTLELSEKRVTQHSKSNGQDQSVTEIYTENVGGLFRRSDNRLELDQRVRVTSAGEQTIREVEARNPLAPNEPLRVIERTVETRRQVGPDRWEVQRQVFARDGNGRLVPIVTEKGEASGK